MLPRRNIQPADGRPEADRKIEKFLLNLNRLDRCLCELLEAELALSNA
jgi:hypothetical protein